MLYRYKNIHGKIKYGDTTTARSAVLHRILVNMDVGQRRSGGLHSAGILWIERLS